MQRDELEEKPKGRTSEVTQGKRWCGRLVKTKSTPQRTWKSNF